MYTGKEHIHFVGIGGIGMSSIAIILAKRGYTVSGCDLNTHKKCVQQLLNLGCTVSNGNNTTLCRNPTIDIVVYSSAIQANNAEIVAARQRGIPVISRACMLAELMRTKYSIAVAGAHGKTTTSSLITHMLIESQLDPTAVIGGHLINIDANAYDGNGNFFVAEADESDRSFLHLKTSLALVTNINLEHLDTYKDLDDIKQTYINFLKNLPFYGKAFLCLDDPHIKSILPISNLKIIGYGLHHDAEVSAHTINLLPDRTTFTVLQRKVSLGEVTLYMPGEHNVRNCLGALAVCLDLGVPFTALQRSVASFKGVERRFWFRGIYNQTEVFDDYAVHPHEIEQTINSARKRTKGRLVVVWEPHRYSRVFHLHDEFIRLFSTAEIDALIITDIYAASEKPIEHISGFHLAQTLRARNSAMHVYYAAHNQDLLEVKQILYTITKPQDLVLLLGAGKLTYLPETLATNEPLIP
jgi:UDP-N-acetylmuramate--alanine ligase